MTHFLRPVVTIYNSYRFQKNIRISITPVNTEIFRILSTKIENFFSISIHLYNANYITMFIRENEFLLM